MFRFSIRDVLWLTVVVAVLMAWWIDRTRLAERLRPLADWEEFLKPANLERALYGRPATPTRP